MHRGFDSKTRSFCGGRAHYLHLIAHAAEIALRVDDLATCSGSCRG